MPQYCLFIQNFFTQTWDNNGYNQHCFIYDFFPICDFFLEMKILKEKFEDYKDMKLTLIEYNKTAIIIVEVNIHWLFKKPGWCVILKY